MARPHPNPSQQTAHRLWHWAVWGAVLGSLWASLVWAPARWLAEGLAWATQGQVVLAAPRGSVWHGSAQLVLAGGAGSRDAQALPGRIDWHMGVSTGLALDVRADCCMRTPATLHLTPDWGSGLSAWTLQVSDHSSQWPAALLSGLGAPWNTLQPEGRLLLRTQALQWQWHAGRLQWLGLAELTAQDLSSRLSTLRPMGSYRVQVQAPLGDAATATPQVQLSTLSGALQLSGQGQWVGQRLRFTGEASAAPEQEAALSNLLNIIGRRQGTRSLLSLG